MEINVEKNKVMRMQP